MIPFNLFNILYAFMTMIYILWILIFLLINGRIHWPGSSDRPGCAGPRADGVPVSSGQRLFGIGLKIGDNRPGQPAHETACQQDLDSQQVPRRR